MKIKDFGGYLPPQDTAMEEVILGQLILVRDAFDIVSEMISGDMFYKEAHSLIYKAISELKIRREPVDVMTVTNELKKLNSLDLVGGPFAVTQLTNRVASGANIEAHCRILMEKYARRKVIELSQEQMKYAYDDTVDIFSILQHSDSSVQAINDRLTGSDITEDYASMVDNTVQVIEKISTGEEKISGIPTSSHKLDEVTGGWQKTDLIILAARPGMGKSTRALMMAKKALMTGKSVVMFSLEMGASQLIQKQINDTAEIPVKDLRTGNVNTYDLNRIKEAANELKKYNFHLIEKSAINLNYLTSTCRRIKKKHGLDLIIVDYLQLMKVVESSKGKNRENEISEISSGLKMIAKDFDVPVIALAQLSRAVEQRADKRPMLSDLRECLSTESTFIYTKNGPMLNTAKNTTVLSMTKKGLIEYADSENIPKASNKVYRVKTMTGRYIDATENHKIYTDSGWVKVKDITIESSLAVAIGFHDEENKAYIPESRFIGWMLGNGSCAGYSSPSVIFSDKEVSDAFCKFFTDKWGFSPKKHKHKCEKVFQWDMTEFSVRTPGGNIIRSWLKEKDLYGRRSKEKYIPQWFMESANKDSVVELLCGLWETDGSIPIMGAGNTLASFASTSILLANQVQYLLASLGIAAKIDNGRLSDKATTKCYKVSVTGKKDMQIFRSLFKLIGIKYKKLSGLNLSNLESNFGNRISLKVTNAIGNKIKDHGISISELGYRFQGKRINQSMLRKVIDSAKLNGCDLSEYEYLINDNIYWDKVVSITPMGEALVFDRYVPENSSFIANGIIVHNSGALEQDADMVLFLYRPSYYYNEVDKDPDYRDMNPDDYQLLSELIISKHRNGDTGLMVQEKFKGNLSRFYSDDFSGKITPNENVPF